MKKIVMGFALLWLLAMPVSAAEITAPDPPDSAQQYLPDQPDNFSEGLRYVISVAIRELTPDLGRSMRLCGSLLCTALILSVLKSYEGKSKAAVDLVGVIAVAGLLMDNANGLIRLGDETVTQLSEYGKMLVPVMTAALAAQGGSGSAAALYTATAFFDAVLSCCVTDVLVPGIYIFLTVAVVNAAVGDALMKKMKDFVKWLLGWGLKIILYAFTGYVSITGVVSGTADQTALKAAKVTFGSMIPVVGSIISDASETILVGAAVVKNSIGIYGMLVLVAIVIGPFLKIGLHYLLLKLTAAVCGIFCEKTVTGLMEDFSAAMGLVLAMTGTVCLLFMISMTCFLKGMG